ncbi:hypothetical protein C8J56DRAFT_1046031 [Mycena floridula]|nr:hypothetical protein C8J56DRAFT_1046031 [Mycena floridula]
MDPPVGTPLTQRARKPQMRFRSILLGSSSAEEIWEIWLTVSLSSITAGDFDPHSRYVSDTLALLARDAPLAQCTIEVSLDEFPIRGQGITQSNLRPRKRFVLAGETRTAIWFRDQGATLLKRREPLRVRVVDKHAMALSSYIVMFFSFDVADDIAQLVTLANRHLRCTPLFSLEGSTVLVGRGQKVYG